ncbi:uncharacterized protein [Apostichopus japonicus]|uniref:uncharacterized protein n=1 Tax=Stichopus japonicus TaxID=307972 RepID=UPI003AB45555
MWYKLVVLVYIGMMCYHQPGYGYPNDVIFEKCSDRQNDCSHVAHIMDIFLSPERFYYNYKEGKCSHVYEICSISTANLFATNTKCENTCQEYMADKKICSDRAKWYKHGELTSTKGCCMCTNGLISCAAQQADNWCHENRRQEEQFTPI